MKQILHSLIVRRLRPIFFGRETLCRSVIEDTGNKEKIVLRIEKTAFPDVFHEEGGCPVPLCRCLCPFFMNLP